jgi:hypothetical protein
MIMPAKTRGLFACAVVLATAVFVPGCEIENPTAVTVDTADPVLLIRGARSRFSDAMGLIGSAFVASDEGLAKTGFQYEDQTGDISTAAAYNTWYSQVHQARRLSAFAIRSAETLQQPEPGYLAAVWHGWTLVRLAELWGDQPFDGGPTVTATQMLTDALADFDAAKGATADSTRHRALAGIARVNWIRGRDPVDATNLEAAIDAAQQVVAENPTFLWVELPNFNPFSFAFGRSYGPTPFYRDIPIWFPGFPQFAGHDTTLTFNATFKPQGVVVISATELRLIQAEAHLLLGNLAAAKTALKAAPLLPQNYVGVCRAPDNPPLTASEIDACVDQMDADAVMQAIDALRREDWYLSARRDVTDDGTPIMPFQLPRNA